MQASAEPPLPPLAVVEMLRRELDASKSVTDHLRFLGRVAADEPMTDTMRAHLVQHIAEEEQEHQEHLARLIPAIEALAAQLGSSPRSEESAESKPSKESDEPARSTKPAPSPTKGFTVGSLIGQRPWYTSSPSTDER